ncbi:class I fructose-bisphosphate aldolase [Herminiimonas sp. CN]|uniref:class I fructose-bisphosphate aldolase n=1 Tax=Herminiimonas sp. CN TaxID=1349818 RepID=UPI0004731909|nr:class I fructose-bisphosphate aldolase [Herminiimonas sp. CN]
MSIASQELEQTVAELTASGRGILAADESTGTIEKRFKQINVASTEESRRDYREILFSTPGLGECISGVILFEETLKQNNAAGVPLLQLLTAQGIVPGIKVDGGLVPLAGFSGEKITQGLDGLPQRLAEYRRMGARFAKWRAVIAIDAGIPTPQAISANAHLLARYAAICQELGLVPIVEPEVLMDGDHTLATCARVTENVLHAVFHALHQQRVRLECLLLKPNMVVPGSACPEQATPQQIAQATLNCLRRTVPAAVPGINFLSGGQSDTAATANLNAINLAAQPWSLSFSYGRALQAPVLQAWRGESANKVSAQQALYRRARLNSLACRGRYTADMEIESTPA